MGVVATHHRSLQNMREYGRRNGKSRLRTGCSGVVALHRRTLCPDLRDGATISGETVYETPPASEGSLEEVPSANDQSGENTGLLEAGADSRKQLSSTELSAVVD